MATRIFIRDEHDSGCAGYCLYYACNNGTLRVDWCDFASAEVTGVKPGEAYIVTQDDDNLTLNISPLKLPRRDDDLLMWLLGFGKEQRTHRYKDYAELRQRRLPWEVRYYGPNILDERDGAECLISGKGYSFDFLVWEGKFIRVAAYIGRDCKVDKDFVKKIINERQARLSSIALPFPRVFIQKVLHDRFGLAADEIEIYQE